MPNVRRPRSGSLQIWPRVRCQRPYPRLRNLQTHDGSIINGFIGYKAGMSHVQITETRKTSPLVGQTVNFPVTIIECPPIKTFSVRYYKKTDNGLKLLSEIFNPKLEKEITRKTHVSKKPKQKPQQYDEVRVVVYSQPKYTGIGKKKPELIELKLGGSKEDQDKNIQDLMNKDIKPEDVFKEGELVDVHAVTKGKGTQGPVKRFGVKIRQHKAEKTKRGPGSLGGWKGQGGITWRVAHAGKMGFHARAEYNKWLMKIITKPEEINPNGGFVRFGFVKNPCMIIKGSVAGPKKRPIIIMKAIRPNRRLTRDAPVIKYFSKESQQ